MNPLTEGIVEEEENPPIGVTAATEEEITPQHEEEATPQCEEVVSGFTEISLWGCWL